eukprot:TRINITY_DN2733_c0_g1_i4.p1 TRINITY_DN2733_c0_g1~~TRINITY_DN2733_c0_g1_i4.p1  ORF type:complete len:480 (-),score=93.47 TRINITY_DN2733_c0_g1_i4:58-1497(-)
MPLSGASVGLMGVVLLGVVTGGTEAGLGALFFTTITTGALPVGDVEGGVGRGPDGGVGVLPSAREGTLPAGWLMKESAPSPASVPPVTTPSSTTPIKPTEAPDSGIVTLYYNDESFRAFKVSAKSSCEDLAGMFAEKMGLQKNIILKHFAIHLFLEGKAEKRLAWQFKPLEVQQALVARGIQWGEHQRRNKFVLLLEDESAKMINKQLEAITPTTPAITPTTTPATLSANKPTEHKEFLKALYAFPTVPAVTPPASPSLSSSKSAPIYVSGSRSGSSLIAQQRTDITETPSSATPPALTSSLQTEASPPSKSGPLTRMIRSVSTSIVGSKSLPSSPPLVRPSVGQKDSPIPSRQQGTLSELTRQDTPTAKPSVIVVSPIQGEKAPLGTEQRSVTLADRKTVSPPHSPRENTSTSISSSTAPTIAPSLDNAGPGSSSVTRPRSRSHSRMPSAPALINPLKGTAELKEAAKAHEAGMLVEG